MELYYFTAFAKKASQGELCPGKRCCLAEILVLAGGAIPPAPALPASTRISGGRRRRARVSCFHSSSDSGGRPVVGRDELCFPNML